MAHAVLDEPKSVHMGLPLPNGKLAMWLFLVTEIMFFTGLIGTYIILRNGTPTDFNPWPRPHDVHLAEWMGAVNTFVLICSSLTVVLAHFALGKGQTKKAVQLIGVTLALGCVFLVIKAFEYGAKFSHGILPGKIYEKLDGPTGQRFMAHVEGQLKHIVEDPTHHGATADAAAAWTTFQDKTVKERLKKLGDDKAAVEKRRGEAVAKIDKEKAGDKYEALVDAEVDKAKKELAQLDAGYKKDLEDARQALVKQQPSIGAVADSWAILQKINPPSANDPQFSAKKLNLEILGSDSEHVKPCDRVPGYEVKEGLLKKYPDLHVSNAISFGNLWASCYFAMTGFHAIHVLGGLVVFVIILIMGVRGQLGPQHESMLELTGLYWHFVDIVWIFLFPLLYLV